MEVCAALVGHRIKKQENVAFLRKSRSMLIDSCFMCVLFFFDVRGRIRGSRPFHDDGKRAKSAQE